MNKYLNPEALAEALETGATADEIAAEMAKALNDALASKRAKEEAAKRANALVEAEKAVVEATINYVKLLLDAEGLSEECEEFDWEELRANTVQSMAELRGMTGVLATLIKQSRTPAAKYVAKDRNTVKDPIAEFLAANGL